MSTEANSIPDDYVRQNFESGEPWSVTIARAINDAVMAERERHKPSNVVRVGLSISAEEFKRLVDEGKAFADTDPEARFIEDSENACPHCGGSGHKDDVRPQWQPIETAPKDSSPILAAHLVAVFDAWWEPDGRETDTGKPGWIDGSMNSTEEYVTYHPTHWMPLPVAPKAEG